MDVRALKPRFLLVSLAAICAFSAVRAPLPPETAENLSESPLFFFSFLLYKQAFKAYFRDKNAPNSQTELRQIAEQNSANSVIKNAPTR